MFCFPDSTGSVSPPFWAQVKPWSRGPWTLKSSLANTAFATSAATSTFLAESIRTMDLHTHSRQVEIWLKSGRNKYACTDLGFHSRGTQFKYRPGCGASSMRLSVYFPRVSKRMPWNPFEWSRNLFHFRNVSVRIFTENCRGLFKHYRKFFELVLWNNSQ